MLLCLSATTTYIVLEAEEVPVRKPEILQRQACKEPEVLPRTPWPLEAECIAQNAITSWGCPCWSPKSSSELHA